MSKPKTYPIVEQTQSDFIRKIYQDINPQAGLRTLGAANSGISKKLFPASPFHSESQSLDNDRGLLLKPWNNSGTLGALSDDDVTKMFATVIDGTTEGGSHIKELGNDGKSSNVNWLYRDKPVSMNFEYLDDQGVAQVPRAGDIHNNPGGKNEISGLSDKPHWGYPNINVINAEGDPTKTFVPDNQRTSIDNLQYANQSFGTKVDKPFSTREVIGTYFTRTNVNGQKIVLGSSIPVAIKDTEKNGSAIESLSATVNLNSSDARKNRSEDPNNQL